MNLLSILVFHEIFQEIDLVNIQLVTRTDDFGKPHMFFREVIGGLGGNSAALDNQAYMPLLIAFWLKGIERGTEA